MYLPCSASLLSEEQVEQMLKHEMENSRRSMIVVRLHQRLSALRDARERKDIMIKMGVIEQ
jgi:plasmid maintenance system killer protein